MRPSPRRARAPATTGRARRGSGPRPRAGAARRPSSAGRSSCPRRCDPAARRPRRADREVEVADDGDAPVAGVHVAGLQHRRHVTTAPSSVSASVSSPRNADMTFGSESTRSGAPSAITLPKSSATIRSDDAPDEMDVVLDQQHAHAPALGERPDHLADLLALVVVETRARLVEEEDRRLAGDRTSERNQLALAGGELARHRDRGGRRGRARGSRGAWPRSACRASAARDRPGPTTTGPNRTRRAGCRGPTDPRSAPGSATSGRCPARARPCAGSGRELIAAELDRARAGDEAGDRVDEGRLSGAVGADDAHDLARLAPEDRRRRPLARRRTRPRSRRPPAAPAVTRWGASPPRSRYACCPRAAVRASWGGDDAAQRTGAAVVMAMPSGEMMMVTSSSTPPISAIVTGPMPKSVLSSRAADPDGSSVLPNSAPRTLPAPPTTL